MLLAFIEFIPHSKKVSITPLKQFAPCSHVNQRLSAENRRLNRKLSLLTDRSDSVDARLSAIESLLSSLVANLDKRDKVLTPLDI